MSVRRRAIRERVERDRARKAQWDATSASLNRLKALVDAAALYESSLNGPGKQP